MSHGVERTEVARDDGAQALSQLRGLPTAVRTLETLLRLHPVLFSARWKRASPALVRCNILLRPSEGSDSIANRSSRSRGRILRPSVVRSTTSSAASVGREMSKPFPSSVDRSKTHQARPRPPFERIAAQIGTPSGLGFPRSSVGTSCWLNAEKYATHCGSPISTINAPSCQTSL